MAALPPLPTFPPVPVEQAIAAAEPHAAAPPWFQAAIQQFELNIQNHIQNVENNFRATIFPDLRRLMNQRRRDGIVVPFEVVPFNNGDDPTLPPHGLPPLRSVNDVDDLDDQQVAAYLIGYGTVPLPAAGNPQATNRLRKEFLKQRIGASL